MKTSNLLISLVLIAFSGFYAVLIARLPDRNLPHTLGAAFMPWVLTGFLVLLSVLLLIKSLSTKSEPEDKNVPLSMKDLIGIIGFIALIVLYLTAMNYLGFIIASILFMATLIFMSGSRKSIEIILFSVSTTVVVYLLFQKFFNVQLPSGIIF